MVNERKPDMFEQCCFPTARRSQNDKMVIQECEVIPDIVGSRVQFQRKTDGISRSLMGRSRIDPEFDKDLLQVEGIRSARTDPLHIHVAMLVAEICSVESARAPEKGRERTGERTHLPPAAAP